MPRKISGYALLLPAFLVLVMMSPESGITAAGAGNEPALSVPAHWNSSRASDAERSMLQRLLQRLRKDSSLTLLVTGYTDTLGSSGENEAIGFYYASSVAHQLEEDYGFPRDRIEVLSGGETEPIVPSGSFEDQVRNRRVVISLGVPQTVEVPLKSPSPAESKRVLILEPVSGTVERSYQRVKALIEGGSRTALLTVNGISSLIAVQDSRIDTGIVLERGENSIEVMAWDDSGAFGRDSVNVLYRPPPPEIEIVSPRDGETFETTHSPVIEVIGTVRSETPLAEAYLFLNGAPRRIEVDQGGRFSQPVVLIRQTNRIRVEALDIYGKAATSRDLGVNTVNLAPKDMVVYLTWDKAGVDLDLHIWGPDNQHTYYAALDPVESSEALVRGALDLDDKNGFGPEVFTMSGAPEGLYTITARYHHSMENIPSLAQVTVVLHPAEPSRRITRVFGPVELAPGPSEEWLVARISLPEGVFQ